MIEYHVERAKSLATAAKYLWPIPNRGLTQAAPPGRGADADRLGRQRQDRAPRYAEDFRALMPNARVELIEAAGHLPDAGAAGAAG